MRNSFRRPRIRFSLRTLLIVVTLAAIGIAGAQAWHAHIERERALAERWKEWGWGLPKPGETTARLSRTHWFDDEWEYSPAQLESLGEFLDRDFWALNRHPQVTEIDFHQTPLRARHLRTLELPRLQKFVIWHAKLDEDCFAELHRFPKLQAIEIIGIGNGGTITAHAADRLQTLRHLTTLRLDDMAVDDLGAERIALNKHLRHVHLPHNRISDAGLRHLVKLPRLEELGLAHNPINTAGLALLPQAKRLRSLDVSGMAMHDEGAKHLAECRSLRNLSLADTTLTDDQLVTILTLPNLRSLDVSRTHITRRSLEMLAAHPNLESVDINECNVSLDDLLIFRDHPRILDFRISDGFQSGTLSFDEIRQAMPRTTFWDHTFRFVKHYPPIMPDPPLPVVELELDQSP